MMGEKPDWFGSFTVYICAVCGRTITHHCPSTYMPNLNCFHGRVHYIMKELGTVNQIRFDDGRFNSPQNSDVPAAATKEWSEKEWSDG